MYDKASGTFAQSRTSSLNEELGQVEFVFTDKTGTLTENVMVFRWCTAGGTAYRHKKLLGDLAEDRPTVKISVEDMTIGMNTRSLRVDHVKKVGRCRLC